MQLEVKKIYFDMDDTIADFRRGINEICGLAWAPQDQQSKEQTTNMWAAVRDADHFYYHLKEYAPGIELFKKLREKYGEKVDILSAIPKERHGIVDAASDKKKWVREILGDDVQVNIVYSEQKKDYVKGLDCFLIDDLSENIENWNKAGGTGFQFIYEAPEETLALIRKSGLL